MSTQSTQLPRRPLPAIDPDTAPFWAATREHRLVIQECTDCGKRRFPPVGVCHRCRGWSFTWAEVSEGTVFSWVVAHHAVIESLRQDLPYIVALIALGDDVLFPTSLVDVAVEDVEAGMPVAVQFMEIEGGVTLPLFAPV